MANEQEHFNKIFWFLVGAVAFVFVYTIAITFFPIPKDNIRFADTALSFLMGTVVGGAFGYLVSGSAALVSKKTDQLPGTTKADISATITTTDNGNTDTNT